MSKRPQERTLKKDRKIEELKKLLKKQDNEIEAREEHFRLDTLMRTKEMFETTQCLFEIMDHLTEHFTGGEIKREWAAVKELIDDGATHTEIMAYFNLDWIPDSAHHDSAIVNAWEKSRVESL